MIDICILLLYFLQCIFTELFFYVQQSKVTGSFRLLFRSAIPASEWLRERKKICLREKFHIFFSISYCCCCCCCCCYCCCSCCCCTFYFLLKQVLWIHRILIFEIIFFQSIFFLTIQLQQYLLLLKLIVIIQR